MSNRSVKFLVEDILRAADKVKRYTAQMTLDSFLKDEKTADAVVRNLEIIGEAANRLPADFKDKHIDIEWKKIVGLRNRIVHDYFGVDLRLIWQIITHDIPAFASIMERISSEIDDA